MWLTDPIISEQDMQNINIKTLFIGGDSDIIPLEHMIEMHRLVKHSQLLISPNTNHFIFQDFAFKETTTDIINICIKFLASYE